MSAFISGSKRNWSMTRDKEGHREYKLETQVETTSKFDGPAVVMSTPGLPQVGYPWNFGNDHDFWAFCYPTMKVTPVVKNEGNTHWHVEQTFGTRPLNRCQDASIEDPLLEPQKLSGSFVTEQKTATTDRNGVKILTSSHEQVRGDLVEFDNGLHTVRVKQNIAALGMPTFTEMINTVNDRVLWGMAVRTVKLSGVSWEEKFWGLCNKYYTRTFDFETNSDTFDRPGIMDEGTKFLRGAWDNASPPAWALEAGADKTQKDQFIRAVDPKGNAIHALLDGNGSPLGGDDPATIPMGTVEKYEESNFLLLGIPIKLG